MLLFLLTMFTFSAYCVPSSASYYKTMLGALGGALVGYCIDNTKYTSGYGTLVGFFAGLTADCFDTLQEFNLLEQEKAKIMNNDVIEAFDSHYNGLCDQDKKNVPAILKKYLSNKQS